MTKTSQQQKKQSETQAAAGKGSVQFEALLGKNSDDGTRKKKKKKQTPSAAAVAKPTIEKKTKKKKKEKKVMQQAAENMQKTVKAVSGNDGDAVSVPNTTVTAAAAAGATAVAPKRKRRFKPGTVAKREIRKFQNGNTNDGTRLLLRKTPFRRLCKEVLGNFVSDRRFTQEATEALQVATEAVAVEYMTNMAISARLTGHHTVGLRHSHHVRGVIMPFIGTPEIRDAATGQRTFGDATSYSSSATAQAPQNKKHRRKSGTPVRVVVAAPSTVASSEPSLPTQPPQAVDEAVVTAAGDNDDTDSSSAADDASVAAEAVGIEAATTEPASTAD